MAIETHTQTYELKNGTGSAAAFSFSFPLYDSTNELDDVFVYVWNTSTLVWDLKTATTHYNIAGTTVTFTSGNIPASGTANILISRSTDIKLPKADYVAGSAVKAQDLDNNQTQTLYALQELKDTKVDHRAPKILANLDMDSNKITNVASPTAATDAASKAYVDSAVSIAATVGDTAPTNPTQGDRWYDSTSGRTFVYFTDADSSQWVDSSPPLDSGVGGTGGGSDQNVFKTVKVTSGGSSTDVVADGTTDTLELVAGNNVTLTPDATNDKVTINSTATASIGDGDKGDITVSNTGATWTIDSDVVTYAKMQDTTTANRVIGAVSAGELTEVQVNTAMLSDDAVSDAKLKDSNTTDSDRAVGTNHIKDNAVTLAKLEDGTQGDILYYGASGAPSRLAKGTAGKVLTMNSGATAPEWATASGGGSGDIEGVTAGTGLTGGGTSGTVTVNVDVGTTANKVVQLDGNAKLPTVDASNITALNAGQLTAGTIPDARFPATLPAISGANLTNVSSTGPGLTGWVSVKDAPHSATGDGTTDDTSAIQSAIDSLGTGGGTVWFPPGVYKLGSALTLTNNNNDDYVKLEGAGPANYGGDSDISAGGGATLKRTTNGNFIEITNTRGTQIRNLGFKGSNMALGYGIKVLGNAGSSQHVYEDLVFTGVATCIHLLGLSQSVVRNIIVRNPPDPSGDSDGEPMFLLDGDVNSERVDQIRLENIIVDGSPTASDSDRSDNLVGLELRGNTNTVFVQNCSFLRLKKGIELDSAWDGEFIYFVNTEVERCKDHGWVIKGSGNFVWLTNCYSCLNGGQGITLQSNFNKVVTITAPNIRANANHGILCNVNASEGHIQITDPIIADNSNSSQGGTSNTAAGIYVEAGADHISIIGGRIGGGTSGTGTGSQKYAIDFEGNDHKYIRVIGVDCTGNQQNDIANGSTSYNKGSIYFENSGNNVAASSMNFLRHCPGFNPGPTTFP